MYSASFAFQQFDQITSGLSRNADHQKPSGAFWLVGLGFFEGGVGKEGNAGMHTVLTPNA